MQRELAASGLSDEEILAKTLLLQKVTFNSEIANLLYNTKTCHCPVHSTSFCA